MRVTPPLDHRRIRHARKLAALRAAVGVAAAAAFLSLPYAVEHIAPALTPGTLPPSPLYEAVIGGVGFLDAWLTALTPPNLLLFRHAMGYVHTAELYALARLDVAEAVDAARGAPPTPSSALALNVTRGACAAAPADSPAGCAAVAARVTRLLRATAAYGVFREAPPGGEAWVHTAQSRFLARAHAHSLKDVLLNFGGPQFRMMAELPESLVSGEASFRRVHGDEFWAWYGARPAEHAVFDGTMAQLGRLGGADVAVARDAPWGRLVDVVVDVGGGHGEQAAAILAAHPRLLAGVVLDMPAVVERALAARRGAPPPAGGRLTWAPGDMFDAATLPGAHAEARRLAEASGARVCVGAVRRSFGYALRDILHDWADEDCVRILKALRAAMRGPGGAPTDGACYEPDGRRAPAAAADAGAPAANATAPSPDRVLVIGRVVVPGARFVASLGSQDADMVMLGAFGTTAGERTTAHYARLFAAAGLALVRVHPTRSHYGVLEARAV